MILTRLGYLKFKDVEELKSRGELFGIYKTNKNTEILVKGMTQAKVSFYYPKQDRLPWKITEGKKIARGELIYSSNSEVPIDTTGWNNGEQIMSYQGFECVNIWF